MGAGWRPVTEPVPAPPTPAVPSPAPPRGGLHHVEVWVPDLDLARQDWGWLLTELGWQPFQDWPAGVSWRLGPTYLVLERSPALTATAHDRCAPGLNHLAFQAGSRTDLDRLVTEAGGHGWSLLFPDRHPYAGGPRHYAGYLADRQGYEVELIAADEEPARSPGR